jgi:hypothetical protein
MLQNSYSVEYMEASKKSSRTRANGRQKGRAVVPNRTEQGRRPERIIHFLTQDEMRRLFKVMKSKRDRADKTAREVCELWTSAPCPVPVRQPERLSSRRVPSISLWYVP